MENQTHITNVSKAGATIQVCIITVIIAFALSIASKINIQEFMVNILDWQSM